MVAWCVMCIIMFGVNDHILLSLVKQSGICLHICIILLLIIIILISNISHCTYTYIVILYHISKLLLSKCY